MQWMISLETENDPIPACRLLNVFRRKGVKVVTFTLAAGAAGFSLMAVVDTPESEIDHLFNFLRRTEGVRHVTYYRHVTTADASFIFIDASAADSSIVGRFTQTFPESKMVFASNGKYLFEISPAKGASKVAEDFGDVGLLPFIRVTTTQPVARA